ncbi:MAG: curli assembly protein CsgF [Bacteroidia bacterium]|nr:curli assembly protein CsgF [Bacteroidia bacterium]NNF30330.1 curli assembly protein CsgF [Flavobacteriaceae bacterium]MBT8276406.1 curli assembly protein CsgF [Bacteroidia bacterium]NNJ81749.1 curli assembly protein CsgF [Flavobacteriaceae bacterium]NNK53525.1 curli assembly protein CsgF [Flavobacteriaceae bacterium]
MRQIILILFLSLGTYGFAQQLTYRAKNPAFGGDPFNYTWLLNSANAQNPFSENDLGIEAFDNLAGFDNLLNNQFNDQFGGQTPPLGTSRNGNLEYEVFESTQGLVINILDITTGEQTQIIVPNG